MLRKKAKRDNAMGDYNYCLHKNDFLDALFMQPRKPVFIPKPLETINAKADTLEEATIISDSFKTMLPNWTVTVREVLEGCDYTITAALYSEL